MKKIAGFALLALSCSAYDDMDPAQDSDLGQTEEALTIPSGYGILHGNATVGDAMTPCTGAWVLPVECWVPSDKIVKFKNQLPTTSPFGTVDLRGAFAAAVAGAQLNFPSWVINANGTDNAETVQVDDCLGGSSHAYACAPMTSSNSFTSAGRPYAKAKRCSIKFDVGVFSFEAALADLNADQLFRLEADIFYHEIGHCLGLGHQGTYPNAMVARVLPVSVVTDPGYVIYTAAEQSQVNAYQP